MRKDDNKTGMNVVFPETPYAFTAEERRVYEENLFALSVYQKTTDGFMVILVSDGLCELYEMDRPALLNYFNRYSYQKIAENDAGKIASAVLRMFDRDESTEIYKIGGSKRDYTLLAHARRRIMHDGTVLCFVEYLDINLNRELALELSESYMENKRDIFNIDQTTGLPNINFFHTFAEGTLQNIRDKGLKPRVVFFDIRGMHAYNAQNGYEKGDALLRKTGGILHEVFPGDMVVRYMEDHFVVLTAAEDTDKAAEMVNTAVKTVANGTAGIKCGYYVMPGDGSQSAVQAVDKAREALNIIGNDHNRIVCRYDEQIQSYYEKKDYILTHFQTALDNQWIRPYYQLHVRGSNGKICSSEALARWLDPQYGMLSPGLFIPILEEARLVYKLDLSIITQVCSMLHDSIREGRPVQPISVNLSRVDFQVINVFEAIEKIRNYYELDPQLLKIEITESALTTAPGALYRAMELFRTHGYELWMDDFGSDYSSLKNLKDFDFSTVKIDLSFLRDFDTNSKTKPILSSVVDMSKRIGMHTICEGVETEEEYEFLKMIGCEKMQGYLFSKPIPLDALMTLIEKAGRDRFEAYGEVQ